jgi:hypothetical protein
MKRTLTVLALAGLAIAANAQIAYTNFLPGDVYQPGTGYSLSGPSNAGPQIVGMQFTSGLSGVLDTIRFANFYSSGDPGHLVSLYNDNGSNQQGSLITAWSYNDSNPANHITTVTNGFSSITLTAGQKYWVYVAVTTDGNGAWNFADASIPPGLISWSTNNGATYNYSTTQMSAFEVAVVPEPATLGALGLGLAALLARRRKKA